LQYLDKTCKKDNLTVYSSSLAGTVGLGDLLKKSFNHRAPTAQALVDVLTEILTKKFPKTNNQFSKYVFLDAQSYITDPQHIRLIKDVLSRYQLDAEFTVNLIFITQSVIVPPALERLSEIIFFDLPVEEDLKALASVVYKRLELEMPAEQQEEISLNLKGLTFFETEQAILQSHSIYEKVELDFIRNFKKAAIAKTDLLSQLESNVTFSEIGGMENLKKWIQKSSGGWTVEGKKFGLPILKGVLLVGLPGTGKSLICKALGNEWHLPVIQFDPSKIFSSRVGDSESNMRRVLKIIENISPCILFIDEVEKGLAGTQSSSFSDAGVTARVVGSFLIWMQECQKSIFTVATANAIQHLPPELISRFDETFFVNLPQEFERQEIFKIHIDKLQRDSSKFDLSKLASHSRDLSGREIEQALREAMYDAYHSKQDINTDIVMKVLMKKTNLLTTMGEQLKYLLKWVGYDKDKNDGVRARFASAPNSMDVTRVQSEINAMLEELEGEKPLE